MNDKPIKDYGINSRHVSVPKPETPKPDYPRKKKKKKENNKNGK